MTLWWIFLVNERRLPELNLLTVNTGELVECMIYQNSKKQTNKQKQKQTKNKQNKTKETNKKTTNLNSYLIKHVQENKSMIHR